MSGNERELKVAGLRSLFVQEGQFWMPEIALEALAVLSDPPRLRVCGWIERASDATGAMA
jgi:hypothetical protein